MHDSSHLAFGNSETWWQVAGRLAMDFYAGANMTSWHNQVRASVRAFFLLFSHVVHTSTHTYIHTHPSDDTPPLPLFSSHHPRP